MAFGNKTSVAGIIAPVGKIIRQLEEHSKTKSTEAEAHQKAAEESLQKKTTCQAEQSQADTIAAKLKDFFSLN